jgi:hypothetical protein
MNTICLLSASYAQSLPWSKLGHSRSNFSLTNARALPSEVLISCQILLMSSYNLVGEMADHFQRTHRCATLRRRQTTTRKKAGYDQCEAQSGAVLSVSPVSVGAAERKSSRLLVLICLSSDATVRNDLLYTILGFACSPIPPPGTVDEKMLRCSDLNQFPRTSVLYVSKYNQRVTSGR